MFYADSMAFLGLPGKPPLADKNLRLNLAHVTAANPSMKLLEHELLVECEKFKHALEVQENLRIISTGFGLNDSAEETKIVLGLQNPPTDLKFQNLRESGVRIMQLWYKDENRYGGGFACPLSSLTADGKSALEQMAELGIILDLSHAGHQSARDVLAFKKEKGLALQVMASHTGCYSVFPHIRNLPDDVLAGIAEAGGTVGIYTLTFGLHQKDETLASFFEHVAHAAELCGTERITVGSDGVYQSIDLPEFQGHFNEMKKRFDPDGLLQARFPDHPKALYTPGKMEQLDKFGLKKEVLGENLLNFLKKALS